MSEPATGDILAGVAGWPVFHSLSPRMHRFWLHEHEVRGAYIALPVRRTDLSTALAGLRVAGFVGVNLTVPHKEAGFALAHTADRAAHMALAANVLLFHNDTWDAFNTDAEGLKRSLEESLGETAAGVRRIVVLGAGGAARAAVLACDGLGAKEIWILNRTRSRAETLVQQLSSSVRARLGAAEWDAWKALAPATRLLVNATSAGLNGTPSPPVALETLPRDAAVCDLVYNPLETPLLARARACGLTSIDGLGMLLHQGALAFELLFGVRPSVSSSLRSHLEQVLRNGA